MNRLLLVDDDAGYRKMIKDTLVAALPSLCIKEAGNGKEALREIDDCVPEAILMDVRLAGGNGLSLTRRILREHPAIAVAILSGYDLPEYREYAFQSGAKKYLVKQSVLPGELIGMVRGFFSDKET